MLIAYAFFETAYKFFFNVLFRNATFGNFRFGGSLFGDFRFTLSGILIIIYYPCFAQLSRWVRRGSSSVPWNAMSVAAITSDGGKSLGSLLPCMCVEL